MKKVSWAAASLLLITLIMLGVGCSSDKGSGGGSQTGVGSVQIIMTEDTLTFLPGDSASAYGFVVVKDASGRVMQGVVVDMSLSQPFGFIEYVNTELRDTTNELGRVEFQFRSYGQSGTNTITASVGQTSDSWRLVVRESRDVVASLSLVLSKTDVQVPRTREDSVLVTVTISDSTGNGVRGTSLNVTADGGRLKPLEATDSTGRATTWWYSNYQFGTFTLRVHAGSLERSAQLTVTELENVNGTLELIANPRSVYADHCVTRSHLTATLRDQYGTAVTGDTILFSASMSGSVNAYAVTDSMGQAHVTFCGDVPDAVGDSAFAVARHRSLGLVDTVRIRIAPVSAVNVYMTPARTRGTAGVDSTSITVTARFEDGFDVDGDTAYFWATCGSFTAPAVQVVNGHAENVWKFCNQTTHAAFRVWATVYVAGATDSVEFEVDPGPARRIDVEAAYDAINMGERLPLWADVADSLGNPVRSNVPIMFESTIGTLSPQSPVATNDSGRALVELSPGTQAGQAVVKATVGGVYVDSTVVTVISGDAASIQLDVPNPSPQVAGTGGQDWTQLRAIVHDANGNAVPDGQWVTFSIVASPGQGCNINGVGQSDSAQTAAGLAVATFNAGRASGPVTIRARTRVESTEISAQASNISVVAGPPNTLDIQPTEVGTDAEIAWDVIVAALVRDVYNNPVRDGIAVFFSVTPDTAMILSEVVVTGNSPQGQPDVTREGVAYTVLRYISAATNQTVDITGRTADGVSEMIHFTLPIQQPAVSVNCYPSTWHFGVDGNPCRIRIESIVVDGHGWPINNAKVIYSTTRGRLYTTETGGSMQNYNFTGPPFNATPGHTVLWLRDTDLVLFPDAISTEITCEASVEVERHPEAFDSQIISLRRFPPG